MTTQPLKLTSYKINVFASGGKGGVGKSIVASAVAYAAATMTDKKVILVCGDPHTGSAEMLVPTASLPRVGWVEYLNDPQHYASDIVVPSEVLPNLLVIHSRRARTFYSGGIPDVLILRLKALRQVWEKDPEVGLVVIDAMAGRPHDLVVYTMAFNLFLVANPDKADLQAAQDFIRDVEEVKSEEGWTTTTTVNGVIANRVAKWSLWSKAQSWPLVGRFARWWIASVVARGEVARIEKSLGMRCIATIPESEPVAQAVEAQQPVTRYKPGDKAAEAIKEIATMLLNNAKKAPGPEASS